MPDGQTIKRTSDVKTYTHVVVAKCNPEVLTRGDWGVIGWCGSPKLAQSLANTTRSDYYGRFEENRRVPMTSQYRAYLQELKARPEYGKPIYLEVVILEAQLQ